MKEDRIIPKDIAWPFILLTSLFFTWAIPNNLTDTMLAAFKRIMSLTDTKTAWIQIACYLLGYGCFAIPGALFIKRYTYKSGVMLGLGVYATGTFLFYPAMLLSEVNIGLGFFTFLFAIFVLFAGLSVLETSANSYVCAIGPETTATLRLNFSQSFNPFGAVTGVIISQVFVLSHLNTMGATERAALSSEELTRIQGSELNTVTSTYMTLGLVMVIFVIMIWLTRMPDLREDDKKLDFRGAFNRLKKNKNYVWGVIAQFFYVGAQIAVWSFTIRYVVLQLHLDSIVVGLGSAPSSETIIEKLRGIEPLASGFYNVAEKIGFDPLLPRTAEQAGATYLIMSLIMFVVGRFVCTALMKYVKPRIMLVGLSILAFVFCIIAIYARGFAGVYALVGISFCMSMMFPTVYAIGIAGLKGDTKIGGAGMVMAIAGAAVLTQIQGIVSDQAGSIKLAYWVPAIAFVVIAYYGLVVSGKKRESLYHQ